MCTGPRPPGGEQRERPRDRGADLVGRRHPVAERRDAPQRLGLAAHLVQQTVAARGWRSGIPGETTSSGTLSEYAWPTAAAMFSSAGPVVVIATPGRPLTRAYASAAYPAPCS